MRDLTVVLLALLLLPGAGAISISGERVNNPLLFTPGETYSYTYVVSRYPYDAVITLEGDWAQYASVSDVTMPRPGEKHFSLTITPPRHPETPGNHFIYIGAKEVLTGQKGGVGAVAAVRKQIIFNVLYDYKRISANLVAPDVNIGDPVEFLVTVKSESLLPINHVKALIEITDSNGKQLAVVPTDTTRLKLGQGKVLSGTLDTTGYPPATYQARAVVTFDGNSTIAEDSFRIGTLAVEILNFTREVEVGTISPFIIRVESGWNDPLEGIYGEVYVNQTQVAKTPSYSLSPWGEENLTAYIDTTGWSLGDYESVVTIHFSDTSTVTKGSLRVFERKDASTGWIASLGLTHVLIAVVALLAMLLVVNFYLLRKRRKTEGDR